MILDFLKSTHLASSKFTLHSIESVIFPVKLRDHYGFALFLHSCSGLTNDNQLIRKALLI